MPRGRRKKTQDEWGEGAAPGKGEPPASNSADIVKVLADARPELERIDAEIAGLNEQKKEIHKAIKEKTGMPQSCWRPLYKLRQLVDADGVDSRERLAWMAMAAEAFQLCEPGGMVDMFSVGGVDPSATGDHPLH